MKGKERLALVRTIRANASKSVVDLTQTGSSLTASVIRMHHDILISSYEKLGLNPPTIDNVRAKSMIAPLVAEFEKLISTLQDSVAMAVKASELEDRQSLQDHLIAASRFLTTLAHCRANLSVQQTRLMTRWLDQTSHALSLQPPVFSWKTPSEKVDQLISAFEAIVAKLQEKVTQTVSQKKKRSLRLVKKPKSPSSD